jgi:N utilization substance protein B
MPWSRQIVEPDELTELLVRGVVEHRDALDAAIAERATGWSLARCRCST